MGETLITELLRYCKTMYGNDGNDLSRSSSARDVLAAEIGMLKSLVTLGRAAMQRWSAQLGDGCVGSRATHNGVRYRFVGFGRRRCMGCSG